ncbi:MAG: ABC transporter ATP-binding protein [Chloroflexi bacterium]|nr:ABC transporter ATP-binding protein [Chloroflexota bacterium]
MTTQLQEQANGATGDRVGLEVEFVDLRKSFGSVRALRGLTLRIAPGELVALLGPSGCGKTTALRVLAGLEQPDAGEVRVAGSDITAVPVNRRNMGVVFQAYSLFPNLTARENVGFGVRLRKLGREARRRRVDELLDLVGLASHANHYPHQLSGGQQQRIALARALAIQPSVLLLDEPLSALDAKVRAQLRDEIRRIQLETGVNTLFVTHDQEEALVLADRVGVMSSGELEQIAPPKELYDKPRTQFVAEFVGVTSRLPGVAHGDAAEVFASRVPLLEGSPASGDVIVLARPEAVDLRPDADGAGRVLTASFAGSYARARVGLPDGTAVTAQVPSSDIALYPPGTAVRVSLRPIACLAIPLNGA